MPGEFVYKPLNLLDLFIVSETIEGKIGEEWEVTCKVIGEKRRGGLSRTVYTVQCTVQSVLTLYRAQPKPPFRHILILVSGSSDDNIDSSVLRPI